MNNLKSIGLAPRLAVGVLAVMAGTMALAQEAQQMPQVTVQAEREVTITRGDRVGTSSRHMGQLVSATQTVDLSDLHLGSAAGAHEAHQRIDGAARAVCSELTAYYPNGATDVPGYERTNENCVRDAAGDATERIHAVLSQGEEPLTMIEPIQIPSSLGDYTPDFLTIAEVTE